MQIWPKFLIKCILPVLFFIPITLAAASDFQTKTLSNGIKVIYQVQSHVNKTCVRIVLPTGLIYEPRRLRGISHLLEHLIFRGSEQTPPQELSKLVDEQGGYTNGYVYLDHTEFYMEVSPANLIAAISIYLDYILQPKLAEQHIVLEKKIISVEKALRDIPGNTFFLYLNELTQHQFDDSVNNIARDDLQEYHRQFYRPDLMTVIITGSFKPTELFELLQGLSCEPAPAFTPADWLFQAPAGNIVLQDYLMGEKYQILFGFELKNLKPDEILVAKVLPYILEYESHQYDHLTNRPVDYRIALFNLAGHYFLTFIYRDPVNPYSLEISEWHQKNLARYFKYLQAKKFEKFLAGFSKSQSKLLKSLKLDPAMLNEYISLVRFDPAEITSEDLQAIKHLSTRNFKKFVQKYLVNKYYQKIVIKAL